MLISGLVDGERFPGATILPANLATETLEIWAVLGLNVEDKVGLLHDLKTVCALPLRASKIQHFRLNQIYKGFK